MYVYIRIYIYICTCRRTMPGPPVQDHIDISENTQ